MISRGVGIASAVIGMLLGGPARGRCSEHIVSTEAARRNVVASAEARADQVATIRRALSTPAAERAGAAMGVSLDRVRAAVPSLSDAELRDLAARAAVLPDDPAGGSVDPWVNDILVVILIVGIVALVLSVA